jgi:hypothetical protein
MRKIWPLIGVLAPLLVPAVAQAANSPTFRDCSLVAGIDPDFMQLSGVTPTSAGPVVPAGTGAVALEASESADPGDSTGHDTLTVTVTATGAGTRTVSGSGTGRVNLSVPLASSASGAVNTIAWKATFDNGVHPCPGGFTPQNPGANPFIVTVAAGATPPPPVAPVLTRVRESHRSWREPGTPAAGHVPVGTVFGFHLDHAGRVELSFAHADSARTAGTLTVARGAGTQSVRFTGGLGDRRSLAPGRYIVTVTAIGKGGLRSQPAELPFTIVR